MNSSSSSRLSLALAAVAILVVLSLTLTRPLPAQLPQHSFGALFAPYVGKEVSREGASATVLEVGADYLILQYPNEQKEALPFHSIRSVRLQEKPELFLHR